VGKGGWRRWIDGVCWYRRVFASDVMMMKPEAYLAGLHALATSAGDFTNTRWGSAVYNSASMTGRGLHR